MPTASSPSSRAPCGTTSTRSCRRPACSTASRSWPRCRTPLAAAEARYGVPQATIVAIWGMESDYGANYGDIPTIDALATLGFEGRREAWARSQLMAALKILQGGDIDRAHMIGSWAGAMGQTQFLPSAFLSFAVDADGDGRRDIWGSMPDVTASTANFLARSGWQDGPGLGRRGEAARRLRRRPRRRRACARPARSGRPRACRRSTARRCPSSPTARSWRRPARAARPSWWARTSARSCATTTPPATRWP